MEARSLGLLYEAHYNWSSECVHLVGLYESMPQLSTSERETLRENALRQCSEVLHQCAEIRGVPVTQLYNFACLLARRGHRVEALDSLRGCLRNSEIVAADVRKDPDWAAFYADPEWLALVTEPS